MTEQPIIVYVPFTDIGAAVLQMLAATRGITISAADGAG
jgi:2-haloacid dehalogenase